MALITTQKLYIDIERGVAYASWNNFSSAPTPVFHDGDTARLELHLVRSTNSSTFPMEDVAFPSATITAAVGTPGSTAVATGTTWTALTAPLTTFAAGILTVPRDAIGGTYNLTITKSSPALAVDTIDLPFNASAAAIKSAIETAINSVAGFTLATATVTSTGANSFTITARATHTATVQTLVVDDDVSNFDYPTGYVGELAFTAAGVDTLLGASASVNSTFEVQVADDGKFQTYIQIPCVIRKQVTTP